MSKRHLVQLVATFGAVAVLYVLFHAPVTRWLLNRFLSKPETVAPAKRVDPAAEDDLPVEDITAALLRIDKTLQQYPGESKETFSLRFNRAFAIEMKKWTAADEKDYLDRLRELQRADAEAQRLEDQRAKEEALRRIWELMVKKPLASATPSSTRPGIGYICGA